MIGTKMHVLRLTLTFLPVFFYGTDSCYVSGYMIMDQCFFCIMHLRSVFKKNLSTTKIL